ncbi:MAG: lipopolysaccharide heptosyltransferase I [candidate division NC10 bacterium]|nr:lipopolysaccharide heptosyltransferase I [candidate division NC10 bacterium]
MSSVPIRLDGARRILLVKPSALGDVIHALPVAATLRRRYPNIGLDWLVEEEAADLVTGHPALSGVVVSGRRRWLRQLRNPVEIPRTLMEARRFAADLRRRRYGAVLDLQGLFKSALYVLATGAPIRVGFAEGREGATRVLTHRVVAPPQPVHAVDRYLALASAVDATEPVREFHIALGPQDLAAARSHLAACRVPPGCPCVVLHPAARWRTKLWEVERWRELAASLLAEGMGVILTGSRQDEALAATIVTGLNPPPVSLVGRLSLKQLVAVLRDVDLMITVDSGPMHMAAAVGTPVVALFGPTDPRRTGPLGPGAVLRKELPCSPCLRRGCQIADTYRCMRDLGVAEVLAAARSQLRMRAPLR